MLGFRSLLVGYGLDARVPVVNYEQAVEPVLVIADMRQLAAAMAKLGQAREKRSSALY
jgi:hypothetical protein